MIELGWDRPGSLCSAAVAMAGSDELTATLTDAAVGAETSPSSSALPTGPSPRLIDQASSTVVRVRTPNAAATDEPIPPSRALDADGGPTTGSVGSNVAVVVELLSLLFGASPSDAPESASGEQLPRVVLFLPALERAVLGADHLYRVEDHLDRLPAGDGIAVGRHLSPVAPVVLPEHLVARPEGGGPSRA